MDDRELVTPTRALIEEAIDAGDDARAKELLFHMEQDWLRNVDYSINWIASLLSFVGRTQGEPAVEDALRDFGERYLRARREAGQGASPRKVVEAVARAMKANGGEVTLEEDDEAYVLSFRCGSGGKLIEDGAYTDARGYLTLREPGPMLAGRDEMPVYCAHCPIHNEVQPTEWFGAPTTIQFPMTEPGTRCVHRVPKEPPARHT